MELTAQFILLVPVIVGLVQVLKKTGVFKARLLPLLAILLGIGGAYLLTGLNFTSTDVLQGIIVGLSASGLFSGTKATFEKAVVKEAKKKK